MAWNAIRFPCKAIRSGEEGKCTLAARPARFHKGGGMSEQAPSKHALRSSLGFGESPTAPFLSLIFSKLTLTRGSSFLEKKFRSNQHPEFHEREVETVGTVSFRSFCSVWHV